MIRERDKPSVSLSSRRLDGIANTRDAYSCTIRDLPVAEL